MNMDRSIPDSEQSPPTGTAIFRPISAFLALLGGWIAVSPFILGAGGAPFWNNVLVGTAIVALAGYNYHRTSKGAPSVFSAMVMVAVLGVWVAGTPFTFELASDELFSSNLIAGLLAIISVGYGATAGQHASGGVPEPAE